jgi:cell wall-associated NlpC family hydrolase
METKLTRRRAIAALSLGALAPLALSPRLLAQDGRRREGSSPYDLEFANSLDSLIGDLERTERGDPRFEAEVPHAAWYSHDTKRRFHAWGPRPRAYPLLAGLEKAPLEWKRERVIATAARFIGYGYQHHHIPDWNPPASWPWKQTCVGHNGKGVDCSNLTSFVYNQGFGIRMNSAIGHQSELHRAIEAGGHAVSIRTIELPDNYSARQKALRTGDLLYISGREDGPITHVVIWVGAVGRSPSGVPLLIDSHGSGVEDDDGRPIPCGVQLRPFREKSWYNRCASHAHRIFHDPA